MNSSVLIIGLIGIIVFVRYDQMLFAVFVSFILGAYFFINFFGKAGSTLRSPMQAIREDLALDSKEIEKAHGSHPKQSDLMKVYNNFVDFLVKDRRNGKAEHKEEHAGGHDDHGGGHDAHGGGGGARH